MAITFEKVVEESTILNPMNSFAPDTGTNEHRIDPLTKETSFIATAAIEKGIKFPTGLDEKWLNEVIEQTKPTCFFCPENIEKATPKFPPEILPEGRLQRGEACLFPNMLAMAKLTAVVTLSKRHFFNGTRFGTAPVGGDDESVPAVAIVIKKAAADFKGGDSAPQTALDVRDHGDRIKFENISQYCGCLFFTVRRTVACKEQGAQS